MGYLDNSTVTVDAILTKKGRELLARGQNEFQITQFALADDEVDYDLYNPEHPLGTAFYGAAIENMPVTEALTIAAVSTLSSASSDAVTASTAMFADVIVVAAIFAPVIAAF